jgi:hypothetical protein
MVVLLSLSLLVLGVVANHPHDTFAADDLALVADLSNAGSDFHCSSWWCRDAVLIRMVPFTAVRLVK